MATMQDAKLLRPQNSSVDEHTPLLQHAGPPGKSSRNRKRGSRSSSQRVRKSTDESDDFYSDVESLTRRSYSTSPTSSRTQTFSRASTSTCDNSLTKPSPVNAQEPQNEDSTCHEEHIAPHEAWPFFTSIFTTYDSVSLRLENSGSVARDHLASERTFLAYMRTSLAIASAGVALVQLFSAAAAATPEGSTHRLHIYIRPLGASTIGIGIVVLLIGVVRYFTIQAALTKGYFPVSRITTGLVAMMLSVLVTVTFAILLSGKLEPRRQ